MGYSEYLCAECKHEHAGAAWWRRSKSDGGWEYLCGEKYTALANKGTWEHGKGTWEHFESN